MRLKICFEIMSIGDDIIAVPVGEKANEFHGVIKINEEAKLIMDLLKEETTENSIVDYIASEYDSDISSIRDFVHIFIQKLRDNKLIE